MNLHSEAQSCPRLSTPGRVFLEKNVLFSHLQTLPISANPRPIYPTLPNSFKQTAACTHHTCHLEKRTARPGGSPAEQGVRPAGRPAGSAGACPPSDPFAHPQTQSHKLSACDSAKGSGRESPKVRISEGGEWAERKMSASPTPSKAPWLVGLPITGPPAPARSGQWPAHVPAQR